MNVKMKRYLKALVAFVLAFAMVSEAWGGISFVSKAEKEVEVNAEVKATTVVAVPADAVEFPDNTESDWKTATLPDGDAYKLSTQKAFVSFARASRSHTFEGKTVYLNTNIAYTSGAFGGIGQVNTATGVSFQGTFDGQNHTISNMTVGTKGIFASIKGATIRNLVIDNATMSSSGDEQRGLLVSRAFQFSQDSVVRPCLIEGITIKNSTMTANYQKSGLLVGMANNTFPIRNCTIENSTMNCTRTAVDATAVSGYGLVVGYAVQKVDINKVKVVDSAINFDENSWVSNVGGFVGYIGNGGSITNSSIENSKETPVISGSFAQEETANPNQKPNVTVGNTGTGWLINGLDPDKAKISENIGGVIGYVKGKFTAENVVADNTDIKMGNVIKNAGGFVGYISYDSDNATEEATSFTGCTVKNANIVATQYIWDPGYEQVDGQPTNTENKTDDKHYYHNIAGFAACVDKKATFTKCTVDNTVTQTQTRYRCGGGLIGSTFTYRTDAQGLPSKGIIEVSQCMVTKTVVKTGNSRNCNVGGGLIALLSEGSTVRDCYVYDFATTDNTNSFYMGGLIGNIYDIVVSDATTVVENCFVGKTDIKGYHHVGEMFGKIDPTDLSGISNIIYCNPDTVITRGKRAEQTPTIHTYDAVIEKAHDAFTNKEVVFMLNAGRDKDIWTQGTEYPVYADPNSTALPMRKVVFQKEGRSYVCYTNAEGKVEGYPSPDEGYDWWDFATDTKFDQDTVFTENSWVYQRESIVSIMDFENAENANVIDFYIKTKEELIKFRDLSKTYTFEGKTIHLMADIDWGGESGGNWSGIGSKTTPFGGTFNGHGHIISGLYSTSHGLFLYLGYVEANGVIAQPTVKNFTIDNAQITGEHGTAIVVARIMGNPRNSSINNQILNVHVKNSTITSSTSVAAIIAGRNETEGGDAVTISGCTITKSHIVCKAAASTDIINYGFIIGRDISSGYSRFIGCTVTDSDITSENCTIYQVGGVTGYSNGPTHIEECVIDGCTIDCARETDVESTLIGGIVGYTSNNGAHIVDCTVSGSEIITSGITTNVGLIVGHFKGEEISGAKVINSTIDSKYNGESQSGMIGGVAGRIGLVKTGDKEPLPEEYPEAVVSGCELENVTIKLASNSYAVGGMIGRITKYVNAEVKDSVAKDIKINSTYATNEIPALYSFGGAIGHTQKDITVKNVTVEGVQITSKKSFRSVGGFIGLVQGTKGSAFENCKVTPYTNGNTVTKSSLYDNKGGDANWDSGDYSYNVGGFAGLIVTNSSITSCTVESMDVYARERIRGFGGIVGSVFDARTTNSSNTEDKTNGNATLTVNRCTVSDVVFTSGGASAYIGGIAGTISEGSSITNCLISGFKHDKLDPDGSGSNNVGMIVGRQYDTYTDQTNTTRTKVNNCYVQNSVVRVAETGGIVYGNAVGSREGENNYYYQCTLENYAGNGQLYKYCTEVTDATILTNKKLAYNLNTTNGTEPHNGSWAQGDTNPVIATEDNYPVAYVTYLRYNGTEGYNCMEYLKFPIKPDGTIDYTDGERTYISKTDIEAESQVNRQELTNGEYAQEPIVLKNTDGSWKHYREKAITESCTYTSEPQPNSGRVWQYPEGKITTDVTITQVAKTAWDFNGDTKLSVSDLVRLKKSEEKNYNTSVCKASVIGTMLDTKVFDMEQANITYTENKDLKTDGYLPSYRLRRIILTPPSTEVSVLSYNMYYDTYKDGNGNALLNDDTRRDEIMNMLGLKRPEDNETLATRGEFKDDTEAKADIIALQEISADYWHQRLYKEYLAPYQYGTDGTVNPNYLKENPGADAVAVKNGKIDPNEVTSKTYYTYKHVGRGRYGHVFYNTDGNAFAGDSYSLILYDQSKYEYESNKGQSGTIYLSDTPTVASHGWGDNAVDSKLDSQRAANWAIFTNKKTGERFMFVSVHLSHDETGIDRQAVRMKQMELILRKVKEILGQEDRGISTGKMSGGMPVIIAGDFNASFDSGVDSYSFAMEQGYEDARETAVVSSENHGAFSNWTQTDETKFAYGDHFLVNSRCEVQKYEVVDGDEADITYNLLTGTDETSKYHMSDHCPIRATIDIGTDYIASTTSEKTGNVYNEILGFK